MPQLEQKPQTRHGCDTNGYTRHQSTSFFQVSRFPQLVGQLEVRFNAMNSDLRYPRPSTCAFAVDLRGAIDAHGASINASAPASRFMQDGRRDLVVDAMRAISAASQPLGNTR